MLKIVNGAGQVLELAPGQVITVEKNNPLFNDSDDFFQDKSYPGTAPFTENNKIFFNLANLVETPNKDYNFPVTCFIDGIPINTGNINFRIGTKGFEFNLEPNYAAINALLKNIRMTEIRTNDADDTLADAAALAARMMDTVLYPDKYPYIFFPVNNPGLTLESMTGGYSFVNYFDQVTQAFKTTAPAGSANWGFGQAPYFKLTYILQQLFKYLGFTPAGSFFSDASFKNVCIYSRCAFQHTFIYPSMMYMPNMLISDFLKQLRDRFHLAIDFDLGAGVATIESLASILRSDKITDLSPYMGSICEQEVPEGNGFSVTLKSDEQDAKFKVTNGDQDTYPPLFRLKAGDSSTEIELDCSTVNVIDESTPGVVGAHYPTVDQELLNFYSRSAYPADLALKDPDDPTTRNNWPLRLIRYDGYLPIAGGKHYPCASPVNLDEDDKLYYRFINDSKRLIDTAYFPPAVLAGLKTTEKYGYKGDGLNYVEFILEQNAYDMGMETDIIPAKLYARTINFDINTKVDIQPVIDVSDDTASFGVIKAYFDNSIRGVDQVEVEVYSPSVSPTRAVYSVAPIKIPTNVKGTGGQGSPVRLLSGVPSTTWIIVRTGQPKYMEWFGKRYNFVWHATNHYWYVQITPSGTREFIDFYWIVF